MLEGLTKILVKTKILEGTIAETPKDANNNPSLYQVYLNSLVSSVNTWERPHYHVMTSEGMKKVPAGHHKFEFEDPVKLIRNYYFSLIPGRLSLEKRN